MDGRDKVPNFINEFEHISAINSELPITSIFRYNSNLYIRMDESPIRVGKRYSHNVKECHLINIIGMLCTTGNTHRDKQAVDFVSKIFSCVAKHDIREEMQSECIKQSPEYKDLKHQLDEVSIERDTYYFNWETAKKELNRIPEPVIDIKFNSLVSEIASWISTEYPQLSISKKILDYVNGTDSIFDLSVESSSDIEQIDSRYGKKDKNADNNTWYLLRSVISDTAGRYTWRVVNELPVDANSDGARDYYKWLGSVVDKDPAVKEECIKNRIMYVWQTDLRYSTVVARILSKLIEFSNPSKPEQINNFIYIINKSAEQE